MLRSLMLLRIALMKIGQEFVFLGDFCSCGDFRGVASLAIVLLRDVRFGVTQVAEGDDLCQVDLILLSAYMINQPL